MINLILILLLIHYTYNIIFKPNNTTLNCGLFGWAGKNPKVFNRDKFDKLGIFNEKRGEHSCGISVDGDIFIGIDNFKIYRDFISTQYDSNPKLYPTVLGHTRQATYGKHTIENAHPFGFGFNNKNEGFHFIGIHNGTLLNHKELAEKYKISLIETNKNNEVRTKIDSEILLEILFKTGNFKVLSEYNGAAALMFTDTTKPNVIYCYHGKSKMWSVDKGESEERPLFYYKENKNSLYVSSIKDSLESIGGNDKTIGSFEYNTVYKITNGDIENAEKFKISRKNRFQKGSESTTHNYGYGYKKANNYQYGFNYAEEIDYEEIDNKILLPQNSSTQSINIHKEDERIDKNKFGNRIYFNQLRYSRNGHLIKGVYTWIPKFGFYFLDENPKKAESRFWECVNKWFFEGDFVYDKSDTINTREAFIPFVHNVNKQEIIEPSLFYFYKGIRVKTKLDYISCIQLHGTKNEWDINSLSICSAHPVININKYKGINEQNILLDNVLFSGIICPLGSDNIYTIEKGNCIDIKPNFEKRILPNKEEINKLDEVEKQLQKEIKETIKEQNKAKSYDMSEDLLEKEIEEMFFNNYRDFPRYIKRLEAYSKFPKAKQAIEILETFIKSSSTLIALETND